MAQQWQSLASEPRPETNDHPFPSSELVMPPLFSQNPWLQELEMDVTIRRIHSKQRPLRSVAAYQDRRVTTQTQRRRKMFSMRAGTGRLGDEDFPHRRHERKGSSSSGADIPRNCLGKGSNGTIRQVGSGPTRRYD